MLKKLLSLTLCTVFIISTLTAQDELSADIAIDYIKQNLQEFDLTAADVAEFRISDHYMSKHNGVTHVYLTQQHAGIDVFNALINVNMLPDGEVLNYGNRFIKNLSTKVNTSNPQLSMEAAIQALITQFNIEYDGPIQLVERISEQEAIFDHEGIALEPIKVKLKYQKTDDNTVRLAWNVTLLTLDGQNWYNVRVDAVDGSILNLYDQILRCEFGAHTPNNCKGRHQIEKIKNLPEVAAGFDNLTSQSQGTYNVFPLFVESPNHGDRTLVVNPEDLSVSPFGWHDIDGEDGAEYTITRGNNVHAYNDIYSTNQSPGGEPDGGDELVFDFSLDLSNPRPYVYLDAATTNLFYWNNLMHDIWYHYGFDEVSGNFQENNYGNGGIGSDYVNAEALDGSGTNNANFGTPEDGGNPRMQMFLWNGSLPDLEVGLEIEGPAGVGGIYPYALANFGGDLPTVEEAILTNLVEVDDEVGTTTDACEDLVNDNAIAGNVALIDRGTCEFGTKALAAENAGAIAVIVCNNVPNEDLINMAPGAVGDQVTIPAIFMSLESCTTLRTALEEVTVVVSEPSFEIPLPGPTGLDSDFDNGVIVHEYTHGISNRLTGGPNTGGCLTNFEQAGEGWSDWFALAMTTTAEMTAEQRRGIGTYVVDQPTTGVGIRSFPYSRSLATNPHTYADINSESVPHGVGSVFCVTIWDLYWNLVDVYGFDEDIYNGTGGNNIAMQLVMDGLKLQACNPTFLDSRDAIIAADAANYGGANECLIWETFARRGIGVSATTGGGEEFDVTAFCSQSFDVKKTVVDQAVAGSTLTYQLEISNTRTELIPDAVLTDILPEGATFIEGSSECAISENAGVLTIDLGDFPNESTLVCTYQVQLDASLFSLLNLKDGAEQGGDNWIFDTPIGGSSAGWEVTNEEAVAGNFSFFAPNTITISDQMMEIAVPVVLDGPTPGLAFWHWYDTDVSADGGVVEISTDGEEWIDLGENMIVNGYVGNLQVNGNSQLSGRPAFHGNSGGWIETIIDLSDYSEQDIRVRFRFACELFGAEVGWFVDNVRFYDNIYTVSNIACVNDITEERCSETTTIVEETVSSTSSQDQAPFNVAIFPNPTKDVFTLQVSAGRLDQVEMRISGVDGKLLQSQRYDNFRTTQVDLSAYGAGIYFVELNSADGSVTKRVIVE